MGHWRIFRCPNGNWSSPLHWKDAFDAGNPWSCSLISIRSNSIFRMQLAVYSRAAFPPLPGTKCRLSVMYKWHSPSLPTEEGHWIAAVFHAKRNNGMCDKKSFSEQLEKYNILLKKEENTHGILHNKTTKNIETIHKTTANFLHSTVISP